MSVFLFHLATFLGAFLLFQIELIVSKMLLPAYGGSYIVWGACLVFFQAFLLLGYWFVHRAIKKFGITRYRVFFLILLFIPFVLFPGRPLMIGNRVSSCFLTGDIFWQLCTTIGPVFFALATVSTSLQLWLASSFMKEKSKPYTLFASSNAGSLAALASYPFLFEFFLDLNEQALIWRLGYCALVFLCVFLFKTVSVSSPKEAISISRPIPKTLSLIWFLLSAGGVMMFMAATNILTSAIGPMPLVWIMPLGIYLVTFILSFKKNSWCPGWIQKYISVILIICAYSYFHFDSVFFPIQSKFFWLNLIVFLTCLYCHNELAANGPKSGHSLTKFYTTIAFGGFVGGILTTWAAPLVSKSFVEYLLALTLITIAVLIRDFRATSLQPKKFYYSIKTWSILLVPLCLVHLFVRDAQNKNPDLLYKSRNFYGIYEVLESGKIRSLIHQTTLHGAQIQDARIQLEPSSFYSRTSPVGEVLRSKLFASKKTGVIGLGVGTLSIYTQPGDAMDFYELDSEIYRIAKKYFTYLDNAKGNIRFFFGDARMSLAKNKEEKYDLLIMDAFGGSSVPCHLLTKDAVAGYRERLNKDGLILFHTSSTSLQLEPMLSAIASDLNAYVAYRSTPGSPYGLPSMWVALTWDKIQFNKLVVGLKWQPIFSLAKNIHRVWTDNYSSILQVINYSKMKKMISFRKISEDLAGCFVSTSPVNEKNT